MTQQEKQDFSNLLEFINQCPFGLIKADQEGKILLLNALGSQMLLPLSIEAKIGLVNILDLLGHYAPKLWEQVDAYKQEYGVICSNKRVKISLHSVSKVLYLSFTIIRIKADLYQYSFNDVTEVVEAERRLNEVVEATALQEGKLEMATGILHDIGNAATAFGAEVAKLSGDLEWRELSDIQKLGGLFAAKQVELDGALGAGKGQALISFLHALKNSLSHRQEEYQKISRQLTEITSHVQDILNIQRHYVKGKTKGERAPISLRHIIEDALAIQEPSLEKRRIQIHKNLPLQLPPIKGDKTKLIQVLINLLKNAGEAFDELEDERERTLLIQLHRNEAEHMIQLTIQDNAVGFLLGKGESFFEKGMTSKQTGSGFGLYNCRQIIETHQGQISMHSEGPDQGTTITLTLPYEPETSAPLVKRTITY